VQKYYSARMRTKIALRNLYISQAVIFIFLIFAYYTWFPHSFSKLGGFNKTAFMLVFADLILGPLLVFIVFKEGKKYLKFDINVLLSIQIGAFLFGAYSLYLKHPSYAVFSDNRFVLVNVSQLHPQEPFYKQLKNSFFSSPKLVVANIPSDDMKREQLMFNIIINGAPDLNKRPEYFKPLKQQNFKTLLSKSIPSDLLLQSDTNKEKFATFYAQHGGEFSDYAYFPLSGNNKKNVIWVFDRQIFKPIGIIDTDPWVLAKK